MANTYFFEPKSIRDCPMVRSGETKNILAVRMEGVIFHDFRLIPALNPAD